MITREEILSIEEYCAEHKISHKELGVLLSDSTIGDWFN